MHNMQENPSRWITSAVGGAAIVAGLAGAAEMAMRRRGDADIHIDTDAAGNLVKREVSSGHVVLTASLPFVNRGRQQGCVLDATARLLPDGDRYRGLDFEVKVSNSLLPRDDGYFEAIMYKQGDPLRLDIEIHVRGEGDVQQRLRDLEHFIIEIKHSFYMRSPLAHRRTEFTYRVSRARDGESATVLTAAPTHAGSTKAEGSADSADGTRIAVLERESPAEEAPRASKRERVVGVAQPVRTHILTPRDRFAEVVERYIVPQAKPGDLVAIAESALAIMQGRLYHVEELQPRWLARKACRMMGADSSLSTPYGMEMAFRVCGTGRMVAALVAGVAGKLVGRSGDFYRVAGEDVATIDDASGTLAPFDKYVVLGPVDVREAVDEIKRRFGLECAVVDANDLKKVAVLAVTDPSLRDLVVSALIDNPQGNAGEQTPVVLIPRS